MYTNKILSDFFVSGMSGFFLIRKDLLVCRGYQMFWCFNLITKLWSITDLRLCQVQISSLNECCVCWLLSSNVKFKKKEISNKPACVTVRVKFNFIQSILYIVTNKCVMSGDNCKKWTAANTLVEMKSIAH